MNESNKICKERGCGNTPKDEKKYCDNCIFKSSSRRRILRNKRKQQGLCIKCGQPSIDDLHTCLSCQKQESLYKQSRKKENKCVVCGGNSNGKCLCYNCNHKQCSRTKKMRAKRKENGLCWKCGLVQSDKLCSNCSDKYKEIKQIRKDKGLCSRCGKNDKTCGLQCEDCYFKTVANRHFRNYTLHSKIKELLINQKYKCPYTGFELIPGENTSLDHIVPLSLGGENHLENVQWVYSPVNYMKFNLLESDFFDVVRAIVKHKNLVI